jgi:hypothetical protein
MVKAGRALDRLGSARHGSSKRPRTVSEPVGKRDIVLFHGNFEHDVEFNIYVNYNLPLPGHFTRILADISSQALSLRKIS